jgi:hypothetical protein
MGIINNFTDLNVILRLVEIKLLTRKKNPIILKNK